MINSEETPVQSAQRIRKLTQLYSDNGLKINYFDHDRPLRINNNGNGVNVILQDNKFIVRELVFGAKINPAQAISNSPPRKNVYKFLFDVVDTVSKSDFVALMLKHLTNAEFNEKLLAYESEQYFIRTKEFYGA